MSFFRMLIMPHVLLHITSCLMEYSAAHVIACQVDVLRNL